MPYTNLPSQSKTPDEPQSGYISLIKRRFASNKLFSYMCLLGVVLIISGVSLLAIFPYDGTELLPANLKLLLAGITLFIFAFVTLFSRTGETIKPIEELAKSIHSKFLVITHK